ncbi:MAG: hypothetical protein J3R72DRAFT_236034 [Linnemannia gamsii]|nr:MAG: hypothetical protein J3R72DRAFT_236034 [Linnemannia gamsii]
MSSNLCQQSQAHRLYSLYLHYDASHTAKHDDPECKAVLKQCFALMEKDYVVGTVANHNGQLCSSYPSELAILEKARRTPTTNTATTDPRPDIHSSHSENQHFLQEDSGQGSFSRHSAPSSHRQSSQAALDPHTRKLPSATSSTSPFFARTSNTANSDGNRLLHNNTDFEHDLSHPVDMNNSLLEETDDQSFDLGESGMMSFQDIKTELDMIHTAQSPQQRHILPFPFRIPRPEKKESVAIKEYMPSPPSVDPVFSNSKKTQAPGLQMVDKDKGSCPGVWCHSFLFCHVLRSLLSLSLSGFQFLLCTDHTIPFRIRTYCLSVSERHLRALKAVRKVALCTRSGSICDPLHPCPRQKHLPICHIVE